MVSCLALPLFSHYAAPIILSSRGSAPKQTLNLSCFVISSVAAERPAKTCPPPHPYRFIVSRRVAVMHESAALVFSFVFFKKLTGTSHRNVCHTYNGQQLGLMASDTVFFQRFEKSLTLCDDELMEGCLNM